MSLSRSKPLSANTDHDWEPEVKASVGGTRWVCSRCGASTWRVHGDEPEPDEWVCNPLQSSGSALQRSGGGLKRTPIRSVSKTNSGRAHQKDEGLREHVRHLPCCACGKEPPSDPHHVASWGAGHGDWIDGRGNLTPLCRMCHDALDDVGGGKQTFEDYWDLDLAAEAERIGERYREAG